MDILYASPTFLFREICTKDMTGVLKNIASCGFDGLELYGLFGGDARSIRETCDALGLKVSCDHVPYEEFVSETKRVLEERKPLGLPYITIDRIPEDKWPGNQGFSEAVGEISRVGRICREEGIQLLYHSHGYDLMHVVDGVPMMDLLLDAIDPELFQFQPDLGWIALGGGDPARYLTKYRDRCPVVHLKDYYAAAPVRMASAFVLGRERGGEEHNFFEFRPTGYGIMNYAALMTPVLACRPKWIVADHDLSYERDTVEDLKISLQYVKKLVSLY